MGVSNKGYLHGVNPNLLRCQRYIADILTRFFLSGLQRELRKSPSGDFQFCNFNRLCSRCAGVLRSVRCNQNILVPHPCCPRNDQDFARRMPGNFAAALPRRTFSSPLRPRLPTAIISILFCAASSTISLEALSPRHKIVSRDGISSNALTSRDARYWASFQARQPLLFHNMMAILPSAT